MKYVFIFIGKLAICAFVLCLAIVIYLIAMLWYFNHSKASNAGISSIDALFDLVSMDRDLALNLIVFILAFVAMIFFYIYLVN